MKTDFFGDFGVISSHFRSFWSFLVRSLDIFPKPPSTFNVGKRFDWSGSGTPHAWQNFQQLGTHNSYHRLNKAGRGTFWASWFMVFPAFPWAKELAYEHPSIEEQLKTGYRTFELDLHLRDDGVMNYRAVF